MQDHWLRARRLEYGHRKEVVEMPVRRVCECRSISASYSFTNAAGETREIQCSWLSPHKRGAAPVELNLSEANLIGSLSL